MLRGCMKEAFFKLVALSLFCGAALFGQATSSWVFFSDDGLLHYAVDSLGNRIMDFSSAGYMGGGVALPDQDAPVQQILDPSGDDDTAAIQAAIDAVSTLPLQGGFRGMVLLDPGVFII